MTRLLRGTTALALCFFAASWAWAQAKPRDGACFYTDKQFRGEMFCAQIGEDLSNLPHNFNDRIRSIQVFGRTEVVFFNDAGYKGANGRTRDDVPDLSQWKLPTAPEKNWSARISSIRLYQNGGDRWGDNDRDHDRDDQGRDRDRPGMWYEADDAPRINTIECSAGMSQDRQWCAFSSPVYRVRVVSERGSRPCEWTRTFGIQNGRLWTARGCSATFEVR